MMNTEFIIFKNNVAYNIDLFDDVNIPLNYNIDNVFKIESRKANFSKTITIPGTDNNNKIFNHIYWVNSSSTFSANLKTRVLIRNSGLLVFSGVMCLDDIKIKLINNESLVTYFVSVTGEITNISDVLGNLTVRDLDFSEYDHDFTIERIYNSWYDDITVSGVPGAQNKFNTYTSPVITAETNVVVDGLNRIQLTFASAHSFAVGDEVYVAPFVGHHNYLYDQRVIEITGTTITLDAYRLIPYSGNAALGGVVTKSMLIGIGYWYPTVNYGTYLNNNFQLGFLGGILGGTGVLEVGQYYIITLYQAGDDFTNVGAGSNAVNEIFQAAGTSPTTWTNGSVLTAFRPSPPLASDVLQSKYGDDISTTWGATDDYWNTYDFIPHIFLREIFLKILDLLGYTYICPLFDSKIFRRLIIPLQQTFNVVEGNTISINDWLPEIKLTDIFSTVMNMFNLAFIPGKENTSIITFLNRGDFFDNVPIDWTNKVDSQEGLDIELMNRNFPKTYNFKYKDGTDFFNLDYKKDFDENYGSFIKEVTNDFLTAENKVELVFEPSVLTGSNVVPGISPMLLTTGYKADDNGENISRELNNKILIAGMRAADNANVTFSLISEQTPADNQFYMFAYPYAGHIDNHFQPHPTDDINWAKPSGLYFLGSTSLYTTITGDADWDENALYNKHWKKYIDQISNPRVRIVKGSFKLSIMDIYGLDFTIPVIVNGVVMRINKIIDWDVNGDGICNCEFLLRT